MPAHHNHPSREERLAGVRQRLAAAGDAGAPVVEATPKHGGLRSSDVDILIAAGEAEWVVPRKTARLKSTARADDPDTLPDRTRPADDLRAGTYGR